MEKQGKITFINGPVVEAENMTGYIMRELVYVGKLKLVGEIIELDGDSATIQVYEETSGMKPGEPVYSTGRPLSVQLGPGIIGNIFDGIQRPLPFLEKKSGPFIERGAEVSSLDPEKEWELKVLVEEGDYLNSGQIVAELNETSVITHKIMVPPGKEGEVIELVPDGRYSINHVIARIKDEEEKITEIKLYQEWPIRKPRPYKDRLDLGEPLLTGQRVLDTFFPIAKGGTAAIPGGFGAGKTMTQHQLAKWSDADIIIYIGCGERGNEMTDVLEEFPELTDPKTGKSMMERTVLIANTSNMPVSAREASIYTGITLGEYYRDMGYNVAIMADSTSRWAEALREISGRLEEMPAEEGFPAYLPTRLAEFYERAGYVKTLAGENEGSISLIGAVSPPGADFSEPVTQNTKRFVRCFWALDKSLAASRHFPAVSWLDSYSEYLNDLEPWFKDNVNEEWLELRSRAMSLLKEESRLQDIVQLVGEDVLPDNQRLILEVAKLIKIGFLQQNAFDDIDRYSDINKQYWLLKIILYLYDQAQPLVKKNVPISQLKNDELFNKLLRLKNTAANDELDKIKNFQKEIDDFYQQLADSYQK
ncbi:MAG: V-type H+-transporting ATPase subunit A [Halanaerobium sp. 4-GBenrich]|jgi:V/A-type H+-transporting ATPase subunit A|uniref:V-type ATP synthase alpha chain n=1 Tax=Halanaerobium congolense TaxID=54121 RepID=A0A1G6HMW1_9FIRM|nr:V-type ATP synthase subunit A [Halanaerobium congolense]ODS50083.1 MAG: V-type H+-transporting ATPase subunit A [Halanaerobium sp. 4-GBenrich]OEG63102.1 MAG: V-type ATP synthase subunit A [Halanaerobium sp. MDAL1]PUU91192.1 MAG: V-type H+-transporting ATPase subunit A [Halanaerobium sp.]PTX16868.1 V/A-type H+-transporting ATPase subunit A [Halanaerobium congolense]PXV69969.1 V/A-type H+-transporting ATPase subunit A [Halanaerobium congolense]